MKLDTHHSARHVVAALLLVVAAVPAAADTARDTITDTALHRHIGVLASDAFEGRLPGSTGEERTLEYLSAQFRAAGAEPGNGDSFLQPVPLVSWTPEPAPKFTVSGGEFTAELAYREDMVIWTRRIESRVDLDASPLVFAGYGIVAPEYDWNDYEDLDASGKTVVVLVNDPGFATGDPELFTGRAMTYYGRWTYKIEEAARQGAAAVLIVHETESASYGWPVVAQMAGEGFGLRGADGDASRVAVEGWISAAAASRLFEAAGEDFDALKTAARARGFSPQPLGELRASMRVQSVIRDTDSHNVVAVIPGSERPDEYVVFTAHWDHLGREGDEIFNGAIDNASGTAALLVLAEAWAKLDPRPARSAVFVAVTAEEQGLLGSAYYASHPVFPLAQTAAVINIDVLNFIGPTRDITVVGYGASELDSFVDTAAAAHGRQVLPDQRPEAGVYYRSDHFSFAKRGVPALYPNMGRDLVEGGREVGVERARSFYTDHYHKASDAYSPDQDWSGGAADLKLFFDIGIAVADSPAWPNWREGNEFRAIRDAQRAHSGTAAVRFAEWSPENMPGLLAEAGASERHVLVVITQPDWCPGCIQLDRELLRNPSAQRVKDLTRDWLVLEIYGYDEPDASFLAAQGISFLGTPTTLLLKPGPADRRLGEARQVAAIVGYPGDYLEQLERAAAGHDAIAEAQARLRDENDVAALENLARAFLAGGDAEAARRVYRSLLLRDELDATQRRDLALQAIVQPTQRVEKDHRRALTELDAWAEAFPDGVELPDYIGARTWSLLVLGEQDAAMEIIQNAYLASDKADDAAQYLYLAFRSPTDDLLTDAEAYAREAIIRFPEQAARFHAAHGRLLRRLGRLDDAETAFGRAVQLAGEAHPSYGTYLGQLEFVRLEQARAER